jgi:hypothetical protein
MKQSYLYNYLQSEETRALLAAAAFREAYSSSRKPLDPPPRGIGVNRGRG